MDILYKGVAFNEKISVTVIDATQMVNKAIQTHSLSPLSAVALGRALIATTFMASTIKSDRDRVSVTINGDGAGGQIVLAGDAKLNIRGYIDNPNCELPLNREGKLDVAGCVGRGRISIMKSMGLKEPYTGSCEIESGEIAQDFSVYYTYSEQQPTGMLLDVKIGEDAKCVKAGGVIFQILPDADDCAIDQAEAVFYTIGDVANILEQEGIDNFVKRALPDYKYENFYPKYNCMCSKDYIDGVLLTMGEKELYETVEKEGKIEVHCHFCNTDYVYKKEDVDDLLKRVKG